MDQQQESKERRDVIARKDFDLHVFDRQPQSWADGPGAGTFQHTEKKGNENQLKGQSEDSVHIQQRGEIGVHAGRNTLFRGNRM